MGSSSGTPTTASPGGDCGRRTAAVCVHRRARARARRAARRARGRGAADGGPGGRARDLLRFGPGRGCGKHRVWGRMCSAGAATCSSTGSREPRGSACAPAGLASASSKRSCSIRRTVGPLPSSSARGSCTGAASCSHAPSKPSIRRRVCSSSRWRSASRSRPGSRRSSTGWHRACTHSLWRPGGS